MVRYMTLQYRDELQHLRQTELNKASLQREIPGPGGGVRRQSNGATRREWTKALMSEEEKDQVAMDLLGILQKIPIQVIGTAAFSRLALDADAVFSREFIPTRGQGPLRSFDSA